MTGWELPVEAVIAGKTYQIHGDYRDILEIFSYFQDPDLPESVKWRIALGLFFEGEIPQDHWEEAALYLVRFLNGGTEDRSPPRRKLLDWQQDAALIVADVNKVAGQEIRALPFLHWWTFLGYFHAIGEGQLSAVVAIRDKLSRGKKLEEWEKDYYRENRKTVELQKRLSREETRERERIQALLQ